MKTKSKKIMHKFLHSFHILERLGKKDAWRGKQGLSLKDMLSLQQALAIKAGYEGEKTFAEVLIENNVEYQLHGALGEGGDFEIKNPDTKEWSYYEMKRKDDHDKVKIDGEMNVLKEKRSTQKYYETGMVFLVSPPSKHKNLVESKGFFTYYAPELLRKLGVEITDSEWHNRLEKEQIKLRQTLSSVIDKDVYNVLCSEIAVCNSKTVLKRARETLSHCAQYIKYSKNLLLCIDRRLHTLNK